MNLLFWNTGHDYLEINDPSSPDKGELHSTTLFALLKFVIQNRIAPSLSRLLLLHLVHFWYRLQLLILLVVLMSKLILQDMNT